MTKPDYTKHQAEFERRLADNPKLTARQYCEESGLKYATARRYLSKSKAKGESKPKTKTRRTKSQQVWADLLSEFLTRATKNPTLTMAQFAQEKDVNPRTLRRQFNEMRKSDDFRSLFDLYDRKLAQFSDVVRDRRVKSGDRTTALADRRKSAQTRAAARTAQNEENDQPAQNAQPTHFDLADVADFASNKADRFERSSGRPALHGGYAEMTGFLPQVLDALTDVDPLSVCNELAFARAQYARMNRVINSRLEVYEEWEQSGDIPEVDGEAMDLDKERDRLIFGYAPRLRELESSIANLASIENRRALDSRKQRIEELKLPYHLPNEETQLVISVLELRERNHWDAITTAKHIERLGAKVPPALMMEVKAQMDEVEEEVIESGTTIEQLDAITADYHEEQRIYEEETLPARRLEVAKAIAEAEARENGTDIDGGTINKAAEDEAALEEYDALDGDGDGDDLEGFDVL